MKCPIGLLLAALLVAGPLAAATKDLKVDFGAVGDFVVDDTAAVQAAFDWVILDHGELVIPTGKYRITSQLTFRQGNTTSVHGATRPGANWNTSLTWAGAPGGTMLLLDGSHNTEWSNFAIDAGINAAIEPDILVDIDKVTAGAWNSRENAFRRMLLRGGKVATVRISHTTNLNNEANIFEDVNNSSVPGSVWVPPSGTTGPIGYLIQNINAKGQQVIRGDVSGKLIAVFTEDGSAHLQGVQLGGNGTWFKHGGRGEPSSMTACDGDSSRTFLETAQAQTGPFVASANRFYPHYDGPLFVFGDNIGPVVLQGNEFANGGYKTPAQSYMQFVGSGNGPNLIAIGNTFPNSSVLQVPGTTPPKLRSLYALGNVQYGPGNQVGLHNDYLVPNRNTGQAIASLQISGASGFKGDVQSLGAGNLINPNQGVAPITSSANITLNIYTPTIRPGMFEGQELLVVNVGAFSIAMVDQGALPGTLVSLASPTLVLASKASVSFVWTAGFGGRWLQSSPVLSPL